MSLAPLLALTVAAQACHISRNDPLVCDMLVDALNQSCLDGNRHLAILGFNMFVWAELDWARHPFPARLEAYLTSRIR